MKKVFNISGFEYEVSPSMFTMFKYQQDFGRDLYDDFTELTNKMVAISKAKDNKAVLKQMGFVIDTTLKIAYTMIAEQDETFMPYEKWLKQLDALGKNKQWILEVLTAIGEVFQG